MTDCYDVSLFDVVLKRSLIKSCALQKAQPAGAKRFGAKSAVFNFKKSVVSMLFRSR